MTHQVPCHLTWPRSPPPDSPLCRIHRFAPGLFARLGKLAEGTGGVAAERAEELRYLDDVPKLNRY